MDLCEHPYVPLKRSKEGLYALETMVRKDDKNAVFTDITKSRKALIYDFYDFRKVS